MFSIKLGGASPGPPWDTAPCDDDPDWGFTSAAADTPEELCVIRDSTVTRSRAKLDAALADSGLDQLIHVSIPDGRHLSLRRLRREAVDGRVGEDPPAGWHPISNQPTRSN